MLVKSMTERIDYNVHNLQKMGALKVQAPRQSGHCEY
jgi:hypothetical protein